MTIKIPKQPRRRRRNRAYSPPILRARATLKRRGWTQVAAARELGCHRIHLAKVLTGTRQSKSLLERISRLPKNPNS